MDAIVALNPDLTNQKTMEPPSQINNHVLISKARVRIARSFDLSSALFSFKQRATTTEDEPSVRRKETTKSRFHRVHDGITSHVIEQFQFPCT